MKDPQPAQTPWAEAHKPRAMLRWVLSSSGFSPTGEVWRGKGRSPKAAPPSYWLTRFMILRLLGFVYFFAFLSLATQFAPLLGEDGLTPISHFLIRASVGAGSITRCFFELPSLFWFFNSDGLMTTLAWVGTGLSLLVLLGYANGVLLLVLWALYMSFVHVGQDWYGFGWEIQLLETGFLAVFLVPLFDGRPFPARRRRLWSSGSSAGSSRASCWGRASSSSGATSAGATSPASSTTTKPSPFPTP